MTTHTDKTYQFNIGDRVRVVREFYNYEPVPVGSEGVILGITSSLGTQYLSRTTHATMNGGGYDVPVLLDNGRRITVRVEGHIEYVRKVADAA